MVDAVLCGEVAKINLTARSQSQTHDSDQGGELLGQKSDAEIFEITTHV